MYYDTVLFSETKEGLQLHIDYFSEYCQTWKLKVNIDETKIVISGSRFTNNFPSFTFDGKNLEAATEISYIGLILSVSGSFLSTKKALVNTANKAMHEVLKKGRLHKLSVKCQYDLFDKIVKTILLYGCEIWGFSNIELLERVQSKSCKLLLNLKKSTPNCMVYR